MHVTLRTPADDAPERDPTVWEHDCSYLTQWAKDEADRRKRASKKGKEKDAKKRGIYDVISEHVLPATTNKNPSLFEQVSVLFWGKPKNAQVQLAELSVDDLVERLHKSSHAGSSDEAGKVAKELARRKVDISNLNKAPEEVRPAPKKYIIAPEKFWAGNRH